MSDKSSQIKMDINIVIIGAVSVGKSTFTNSLFVEQFSDMNIKRTTSLPQVYHETGETSYHSDTTKIRETNRIKNNEIMNKTIEESKLKLEDIYEVEYYVPPIFDLLETQIQRKNNIYLSIYDTPGLNDCGTKAVYYNYIEKIFYKYDIIIFMIDIFSSLNTSDEIEILEFLLNNMKKNKSDFDIENKLVILLNKCDELYVHKNTILPVDDEIKEVTEKEFNAMLEDMNNPVNAQKRLAVQIKIFLDQRIEKEYREKKFLSDSTRRWVESYNNILEKIQRALHGDKSVSLHLHKVTHSQVAAKMRDAFEVVK